MKTLKEYIASISGNQAEVDMRPNRIMAEQNDGNEELWNSTRDRWSRKAKHPMPAHARAEISNDWQKGDLAIYEGKEVEVTISCGPNSTVGIMIDGKTRMVRESKLARIEEGVMGGMQSLNPINRMMQLAGISAPLVIGPSEPDINLSENEIDEEREILAEADPTNMFNSLFKANMGGEFRNNPDAARIATVGQIMVGLESQIAELRGKVDPNLENKLNIAPGLGALLIKTAREKIKPQPAE